MHLLSLRLFSFRSYEDVTIAFSPGINQFYGLNAQGKSNLIEAIYFLITGRSFRTPYLAHMIHKGNRHFFLEARFIKEEREQTLKVTYHLDGHKIVYNQTEYSSLSDLFGILLGVLISPEDRLFIEGAPSIRRRFIDLYLSSLDRDYLYNLGRYHRALKQKNQLLRQKSSATLQIWEQHLSNYAHPIIQKREALIASLEEQASLIYRDLSNNKERLSISYKTQCSGSDFQQTYQKLCNKHRNRELALGYTLVGPHRDDFSITLNGEPAKFHGSVGQKTSIAISLKGAQWKKASSNDAPLLLIDEIAYLDASRQKAFFDFFQTPGQVILTSLKPLPLKNAKSFLIEEGQIIEQDSI